MRKYLNKLTDGDTVDDVYIAADLQLRTNRNGQPYIQAELRDRTGAMTARMWNAGEDLLRGIAAGDYVRTRGRVQVFNNALQMIITGLDRVDPGLVDANDFLPHADADISKFLVRLAQLLRTVRDPHLKALVEAFLIDDKFMADFAACPAGVKNHHAYIGGLLVHVVTLLEVCDKVAALYPMVDRDLWLMGLFVHDIGKTRELGYHSGFSYTDEGQLLGHLVIGIEMVKEKAARAAEMTGEPFPRELLLRLEHVILSHHGDYEFGSPKLPMTMEALAVNLLDNLDAKLNTIAGEIGADRGAGTWTQYNPSLGRKFYKGGQPSNGDSAPS